MALKFEFGYFTRIVSIRCMRHSRGFSNKMKASIALDPSIMQGSGGEKTSSVELNQPWALGVKPRIVVLGSGWAGYNFVTSLDRKRYDVHVISPSNHFLFTPLLPSCAVGTLEFRAIQEPVRTISRIAGFYQAKAKGVDWEKQAVNCKDTFHGREFQVPYDYLVIACGGKTNTFNTPGIEEREGREVFFLKHLYHARQIRARIVDCFERAAMTSVDDPERERLLSFVVVGGGPTSCEFVGELFDFINEDVSRYYSDLEPYVKVTLVEASNQLLGTFDTALADYVATSFETRNIDVRTGVSVKEFVNGRTVVLSDGSTIDTAMMVWSAGVKPVKLAEFGLSELEKGPTNRIIVDDYLQVRHPRSNGRVFALGDCAVSKDEPLAMLAQVAKRQAGWLANVFNKAPKAPEDNLPVVPDKATMEPFKFNKLFSMVNIGSWNGVIDWSHIDNAHRAKGLTGLTAFFLWRSAYLGTQTSWTNKLLIPMYWFKTFVFGRDISRF